MSPLDPKSWYNDCETNLIHTERLVIGDRPSLIIGLLLGPEPSVIPKLNTKVVSVSHFKIGVTESYTGINFCPRNLSVSLNFLW